MGPILLLKANRPFCSFDRRSSQESQSRSSVAQAKTHAAQINEQMSTMEELVSISSLWKAYLPLGRWERRFWFWLLAVGFWLLAVGCGCCCWCWRWVCFSSLWKAEAAPPRFGMVGVADCNAILSLVLMLGKGVGKEGGASIFCNGWNDDLQLLETVQQGNI